VRHAVNFGVNFSSQRDEYLMCRFRSAAPVSRNDLRLEVGRFGAAAVFLRREDDVTWIANFRLPPGTAPGWNDVRLRLANSRFGNNCRIAVDIPPAAERISLAGVCDGRSWVKNQVSLAGTGHVSCWMGGLPVNADRSNVRLWLGDDLLSIDFVGLPRPQRGTCFPLSSRAPMTDLPRWVALRYH